MSTPLIIQESEFNKLSLRSRIWFLGWGIALLSIMVNVFMFGLAVGTTKNLKAIRDLDEKTAETAKLQMKSSEAIIQVLEREAQTAEIFITWGKYIKDRQESLDKNRGLPLDKPKRSR